MEERNYCEAYVICGISPKDKIKKYGLIALTAFSVALGLVINPAIFLVSVILFIVDYFVIPSFNVDYEYVYCNGQIDFDKIINKNGRKTLLKIDMDNVTLVAPMSSHEFDGARYNHTKEYNFTSLNPDTAKKYTISGTVEGMPVLINFEPDSKMLETIKKKDSRKVVL
ncbi:MAG: DUF6106 family protein [Lachnospiraceae bacterium]|nr:DUF6106 family protein [Lachnospiraceae bacterium]